MKLKAVALGALLFVVAFVAYAQQGVESFKGKQMVPFKMTTLDGKSLTNASLKGKVVLVDFWATWCGPCKAASPAMQNLHKTYAKKGLVVIGANTWEQGDSKAKAAAYAKEHKYTYTFTHSNDALAKTLKINGIPTFLLIDKQGKISDVIVGFGPGAEKDFVKKIEKLL